MKKITNGSDEIMKDSIIHSDLSYLEVLENYSFESKMLLCQKYACRIMDTSEVSMELALKENIMPWELETFVLFSVVYDNESVTEVLPGDVFAEVITTIRNYWHPELTIAEQNGTYADMFIMVNAIQQFPTQGLILQKLFRYAYIFNFENEKINFKQKFIEIYLTEYKSFDLAAFIVYLSACKGNGIDGYAKAQLMQIGLSDKKVMKALQIDKEDYIKRLKETYKDSIIDYYYGLKVQYLWPIIGDKEYDYVPLPYLMINAVTESLLQRLTMGNKSLRNAFGKEVLEQYLYDICSEVSTVTWISPEIAYKIGKDDKRTSDVLVAEDDYCVFYDSKALSPNLKIRKFDRNEIDKNIRLYSDAVMEIYVQVKNYEKGYYSLDKYYDKNKIFGVVVVWDDSYISRKSVYENIFSENDLSEEEQIFIHSHIKIVSLRQIEHMVLQNTSFLVSLKKQVGKPEEWDDRNFVIATTENGIIPCYESYVDDLKARVRNITC